MNSVYHITPSRLLEHLLKTGIFQKSLELQSGPRSPPAPWKVGLCVSGGPDSMALAYLIQNMPHPHADGVKAFDPYAFIIDHDLRDGSNEEAMWVKDQLETLNINTEIRRIIWPRSENPRSMQNFEEAARHKRYQILAELAAKHKTLHLFAGHHEDDQIETMMVRLCRDQTLNPFSFPAMATTSPLPCNEGVLWATSRSSPLRPKTTTSSKSYTSTRVTDRLKSEQFHAGIRLHRPLLNYRKSDLIATCDHFKVPYVQDKTNFDPQLTIRNAVRHLRAKFTLPKALQSTPLLKSHTNINAVIDSVEEQARRIRDEILEFRMYSESGLVYLRLRTLPLSMNTRQLQGFSYFIQRIVNLVGPLNRSTAMLNQELTENLYAMVSGRKRTGQIVVSKVTCSIESVGRSSKDILLSVSRQSPSQAERDAMTIRFNDQHAFSSDIRDGITYQTFHRLWDGRFWFSITGEKNVIADTVIRAYGENDVPAVMAVLRRQKLDHAFKNLLSDTAPGHIRFTLPVLVVSGEIVAFPTLNFKVVSSSPIEWSVQYARDQRSTSFFWPDIKHGAKISWQFGHTYVGSRR